MATVTVEINGRPHPVGCADGQEARVQALGARFDRHVRDIAASVGQVGDLRLFLMAGLMLADELEIAKAAQPAPGGEDRAALALTSAAEQIEKLAAAL